MSTSTVYTNLAGLTSIILDLLMLGDCDEQVNQLCDHLGWTQATSLEPQPFECFLWLCCDQCCGAESRGAEIKFPGASVIAFSLRYLMLLKADSSKRFFNPLPEISSIPVQYRYVLLVSDTKEDFWKSVLVPTNLNGNNCVVSWDVALGTGGDLCSQSPGWANNTGWRALILSREH